MLALGTLGFSPPLTPASRSQEAQSRGCVWASYAFLSCVSSPLPRPSGALSGAAGCGEHLRSGQPVLRGHEQQGQALRCGECPRVWLGTCWG